MPADTIAAVSSPPGRGIRGIVRLSGPRALAIAAGIAGTAPLGRRGVVPGRFAAAGTSCPCFVLAMPGPASYTREDVAEVHLPGAAPILAEAVRQALAAGAREAGPGEFTRRAVENGRLRPEQAEAVMDIIRAKSEAELRRAAGRLAGRSGRTLGHLADAVATLAAEVEASIDFQEHDIPALPAAQAIAQARRLADALTAAAAGTPPPEDLPRVILTGPPNSGKTSLYNRLTGAAALVSPLPGTTRDLLESDVVFGSVALRLVDSPGVAAYDHPADAAAADRAREAGARADLRLRLCAPGESTPEVDSRTILVLSKADVAGGLRARPSRRCVSVSAHSGSGIARLKALIALALRRGAHASDCTLSTRERDAAQRAGDALRRAADAAPTGEEFMALELREAMEALGEVTGATGAEDLLDRIFSRFCIGK